MKWFEYGNDLIGSKEVAVSITSIVVGVGILTLPRLVAQSTQASDGWISIAIAGAITVFFGWLLAKFCVLIQGQGFYAFNASLVTAPVAAVLTSAVGCYFVLFCSFEVRAIANISKQYLFERTPVEYIALAFLLVVAYGVSGSREGIIRLNMMFLPLVIVIAFSVLLFSVSIFQFNDLKPFFITDWKGIAKATKDTIFSLLGFESILFYSTMLRKPKSAPKAVAFGVLIPVLFYMLVYIICVGVFTQPALKEITYPAVELAKEVRIPGEFFERFESIFFTIWIMTIFNTTCMALDVAIEAFGSMMKKFSRITWVLTLCPVVYLVCMLPQNMNQFGTFGNYFSLAGTIVGILIPSLLYVYAKMRGVKAPS